MFEAMKNFMINVAVWVQTGMGPNHVFDNMQEMADYSRAWLDAYYTVEDFVSIMPTLLAGVVCGIMAIVIAQAIVNLWNKED